MAVVGFRKSSVETWPSLHRRRGPPDVPIGGQKASLCKFQSPRRLFSQTVERREISPEHLVAVQPVHRMMTRRRGANLNTFKRKQPPAFLRFIARSALLPHLTRRLIGIGCRREQIRHMQGRGTGESADTDRSALAAGNPGFDGICGSGSPTRRFPVLTFSCGWTFI